MVVEWWSGTHLWPTSYCWSNRNRSPARRTLLKTDIKIKIINFVCFEFVQLKHEEEPVNSKTFKVSGIHQSPIESRDFKKRLFIAQVTIVPKSCDPIVMQRFKVVLLASEYGYLEIRKRLEARFGIRCSSLMIGQVSYFELWKHWKK